MQSPRLRSKEVIATIEKLQLRISERFPGSGLSRVCKDLLNLAAESDRTIGWISRPNYLMRGIIGLLLVFLAVGVACPVMLFDFNYKQFGLEKFFELSEQILNEIVLIGAGVIFLVTFETRRKRKRVITATNRLRCFAHMIDAHQLTKDPDRILEAFTVTQNSPKHSLNKYELGRYLDYCSEMLALVGKLGFLCVQNFNDPQANNAVNDLENLTTAIARKIWQKIMILRTQKTS